MSREKNREKSYYRALTIAGSDSGGGAGIQADLKTFSALGCYGMSVITALTAQNTVEVRGIHSVPAEFISAQLDAVLEDIGVDGVKIGMLHNTEIIETVARGLQKHGIKKIVLDPVMVAKSGDKLLQDEAIRGLKKILFPLAMLITPNLAEASALLERPIGTRKEMEQGAIELLKLGPQAVIVKGGHLTGQGNGDCLALKSSSGEVQISWLEGAMLETKNTHGTGCTFSSAICAFLARGATLQNAAAEAKRYIHEAIRQGASYQLGAGHGPVHHFHDLWKALPALKEAIL